jgi:dissimilatory sulfite reductase (desulfoviridin) alpha/beta subunit
LTFILPYDRIVLRLIKKEGFSMALKPSQIAEVKDKGFLINRGTENFSGRVLPIGTVFTAEDLATVSEIAQKFGNGKVIPTTRLALEVQGIPYENIQNAIDLAESRGLSFGGTGNKIRPITACKGTTCIYGNYDTHALATKLHNEYYLGWREIKLPHKFKIAVGGCPNSCVKPALNDFGVEGHRVPDYNPEDCRGCKVCMVEKSCPSKAVSIVDGKMSIDKSICRTCGVCTENKCPFKAVKPHNNVMYQIYVGGTWGKNWRMGSALSRLVTEEEIAPILEKTMVWFKLNANAKERLGMAIDRLGFEKFEQDVLSNDDLLSKKSILFE